MAGDIIIKPTWDFREAKALMRQLSAPRLHQAMSKAVNDSARQVERKAEQLVSKTLGIPSKRSKIGIWVRPYSTPKTLTAVVRGSSSVIPLKAFAAREKGAGVTAKIWGATTNYPGAFIYGGPVGAHTAELGMGDNVFKRVDKAKLPIKKEPGAAIADAMSKAAVSEANETYGAERLQVNVLRQLDRYTRARRKR